MACAVGGQGIQRASAPPAASLMDSYPVQEPNVPTGDALYALEHPHPQLGPALGPQEVEVRRAVLGSFFGFFVT